MIFDIYSVAYKQKKITKQSQNNMTSRTPFCNMCFKAGKSEKEYASHWLRDRPGAGGVVTCPYLLSIECRYCHDKGHTVTRCPILANKNKQIKKSYSGPPPLAMPALGAPPPLVMPPLGAPPPLVMPPLGAPPPLVMPKKKPAVVIEPEPTFDKSQDNILGKRKFTPKMRWADMCDSDTEDDEF